MDGSTLKELRALSNDLFGGADFRAEIGLAVASRERFCKKDLQDELTQDADDPPSRTTIGNEITLLERTGFVGPEAPGERGGKRFLVPREKSPYWDLCRQLRDIAAARASGSTG